MRARSKLKPGQPGTRKLVVQYGDRLVCVRYRYDALKRRRYTTAEIIVDEADWDPMPSATARRERVPVRIEVREVKLREKVKAAGGRWDPEKRVWHVPMEQVAGGMKRDHYSRSTQASTWLASTSSTTFPGGTCGYRPRTPV